MMKNRNKILIQRLMTGFFCLTIITHIAIEPPILCFESDGHINIESNCNSDCEIPKEADHKDDCGECIDVNLWDYNSEIVFLVTSSDFDIDFETLNSEFNIFEVFYQISSVFLMKEIQQTNFPPFLKNTILLI
ncbi:MAG: hypothetical protein H8D58_01955 [Candidatus Marinimicrobia bacterium]|nr:hypothetical protein [Candidatus Neomarinimicrobiota bacterium]